MAKKKNASAFRIQKAFLPGLAAWLSGLRLVGRESRDRTRFVLDLNAAAQQYARERQEILGRYVNKVTDPVTGKESWVKSVDNPLVWDVPEEKQEAMKAEVAELMREEFVMDVTEASEQKIRSVRDIVLNTDYAFGPDDADVPEERQRKIVQANDYEAWCRSFEALDLN